MGPAVNTHDSCQVYVCVVFEKVHGSGLHERVMKALLHARSFEWFEAVQTLSKAL